MKPGLYEQIINRQMNHELESIPEDCRHQEKVDSAEASRVLATYAAELLKRKMDAIYETSGDEALGAQISYINGLQQLVYRCLTGSTDAYGIEEGDSVCRSD